MNDDLKWIKKKYGEKMMHLCRELFSIILETKGLLPKILEKNFEENKYLYDDIISAGVTNTFKQFIFSKVENVITKTKTDKTPKELLEEAGYDFYECHTEEQLESFKRYFTKNEELCSFHSNRLERCHVFWAIKKNVNEIKIENFNDPKRHDEYGTSVISIQFTKDKHKTLSIKNRYNHTVDNPDATFGNNLENIIPGLTYAFETTYGLTQTNPEEGLRLEKYIEDKNGKLYKYNLEINGIFYCPNNIIIDGDKVITYKKDSYILFDEFILDIQNKKIYTYNEEAENSFLDNLKNIKKINISKTKEKKLITLITEKGETLITLDNQNRLISYENKNLKEIGSKFLYHSEYLEEINMPNLEKIEDDFLTYNYNMKKISLPNLKEVGNDFIYCNSNISKINFPNLTKVGNSFLICNGELKEINKPNLKTVGDEFIAMNACIEKFYLPKLVSIGKDFLLNNKKMKLLQNIEKSNFKINENKFKILLIENQIKKLQNKAKQV